MADGMNGIYAKPDIDRDMKPKFIKVILGHHDFRYRLYYRIGQIS